MPPLLLVLIVSLVGALVRCSAAPRAERPAIAPETESQAAAPAPGACGANARRIVLRDGGLHACVAPCGKLGQPFCADRLGGACDGDLVNYGDGICDASDGHAGGSCLSPGFACKEGLACMRLAGDYKCYPTAEALTRGGHVVDANGAVTDGVSSRVSGVSP